MPGSSAVSYDQTCSAFSLPSQSGELVELTFKLDKAYLVDVLLITSDPGIASTLPYKYFTGPYEIFIGFSEDFSQNQSCTGGPSEPFDGTTGTHQQEGGIE